MFNYKTNKELAEMTSEEIDVYAKEKRAFEDAEQKTAIKDAIAKEIQTVKDASATEKTAMQSKIDELADKVIELETKGNGKVNGFTSVRKAVKEQFSELKELRKGNKEEVQLKALVQRSAIADNDSAVDLPDVGQLATRAISFYDLFPKVNVGTGTHSGQVRYYDWDPATIARNASMIAEGGVFPESEVAWQKYTLDLKKVGDTLAVTEEFFEDEVLFANELEFFLRTNVDLKIDDQLCNGDNVGQNLKGYLPSVPAFTAVASGIQDASIYDLLVVMKEGISKIYGGKYMPNFAVANLSTINKYRLKKDGNNNYVIPPFVSADGRVVDGLTVIESNIMPDNQISVGDNRFARIYEMAGLTLSEGFKGDQFVEDEKTLKVRKRLLFLIREIDKTAFLKSTDIDADLATLATAVV